MNCGQKGEHTSLLVETLVREDAITLYGFASAEEQRWFRLLTSVQGVGAKAGLAILAVCPPDRLSVSIAAQDKAALTQADGVGPKLATRILTELKDKAGNLDLTPSGGGAIAATDISMPDAETPQGERPSYEHDAVSALTNLGYARTDAYSAVMRAKDKTSGDLQDLIRMALKELSA